MARLSKSKTAARFKAARAKQAARKSSSSSSSSSKSSSSSSKSSSNLSAAEAFRLKATGTTKDVGEGVASGTRSAQSAAFNAGKTDSGTTSLREQSENLSLSGGLGAQPTVTPQENPFGVNLKEGSTGPAVSRLQQALSDQGFRTVVDGDFGPKTAEALLAFQGSAGIAQDGIAGPITASKLGVSGRGPVLSTINAQGLSKQGKPVVPSIQQPGGQSLAGALSQLGISLQQEDGLGRQQQAIIEQISGVSDRVSLDELEQDLGVGKIDSRINEFEKRIAEERNALQERLDLLEERAGGVVTTLQGRQLQAERQSLRRIAADQATLDFLQGERNNAVDRAARLSEEANADRTEQLEALRLQAQITVDSLEKQGRFDEANEMRVELARLGQAVTQNQQVINDQTAGRELALSALANGANANEVSRFLQSQNPTLASATEKFGAILQKPTEAETLDLENARLRNQALQLEIDQARQAPVAEEVGALTGDEDFKVAGFAKRMDDSFKVINDLTAEGIDVRTNAVAKGNFFGKSAKEKQLIIAYRDFIGAKLRRESGAAISPEEYASEAINLVISKKDNSGTKEQKIGTLMTDLAATIAESQGGYQFLVGQAELGGQGGIDDNDPLGLLSN